MDLYQNISNLCSLVVQETWIRSESTNLSVTTSGVATSSGRGRRTIFKVNVFRAVSCQRITTYGIQIDTGKAY